MKSKKLVGYIQRNWKKEFGYVKGCRKALIPNILRESQKKEFYFDQFRRVKVSLIIKEIK